jgi:hypothetical protein
MGRKSSTRRIKLAERAGWRCGWCDQKTRRDMGWQNSATIEHVTPASAGGSNKLMNLMSACARCNRLRGIQCADAFRGVAAQFEPDRRTCEEALGQERKHNRKLRRQQLAALCGQSLITYANLPDTILNSKERLRKDRTLARRALKKGSNNPFEPGSRAHRMFEHELSKLPPPQPIWSQIWNKLTQWAHRMYSVCTIRENARENRIW